MSVIVKTLHAIKCDSCPDEWEPYDGEGVMLYETPVHAWTEDGNGSHRCPGHAEGLVLDPKVAEDRAAARGRVLTEQDIPLDIPEEENTTN